MQLLDLCTYQYEFALSFPFLTLTLAKPLFLKKNIDDGELFHSSVVLHLQRLCGNKGHNFLSLHSCLYIYKRMTL